MKRTLLAALSLSLLLGGPAFAGFGIPKVSKGGSKFNTKKVDALLKEIKDVENKYRKAKGTLYLQTESFHGIVDKYGNKKLPKLTKPWPIVDKTWTKAKNDKERGSANKLEATYSKETDTRTKIVDADLKKDAQRKSLKSKLKAPDIKKLKMVKKESSQLPNRNAAIVKRSTELIKKASMMSVDLGKQAAKNPLKAGDIKRVKAKLDGGIVRLKKIPPACKKQTMMAKNLTMNVVHLLK
ncbi:MAG: hypothetical protein KC609_22210 [Myxococcales bacterium]|nr:hypothetical protein [Myxococcales bacterium]